MITGLRSALLCDQVAKDDSNRVHYHGVQGDTLAVNSRPALGELWVALQFDLDGKGARGRVEVRAPGYDETYPVRMPVGLTMGAVAMPLVIPVLDAGELTITVRDEAQPDRPHVARWRLAFQPDARTLPASAAEEFKANAKAAAVSLRAAIPG